MHSIFVFEWNYQVGIDTDPLVSFKKLYILEKLFGDIWSRITYYSNRRKKIWRPVPFPYVWYVRYGAVQNSIRSVWAMCADGALSYSSDACRNGLASQGLSRDKNHASSSSSCSRSEFVCLLDTTHIKHNNWRRSRAGLTLWSFHFLVAKWRAGCVALLALPPSFFFYSSIYPPSMPVFHRCSSAGDQAAVTTHQIFRTTHQSSRTVMDRRGFLMQNNNCSVDP
jgi:hypothetical protein